jgi:hypothetical protein
MVMTLALPVLGLICAAVVVTRVLERVVPESIAGLVLLAVLASGVVWGLAVAGFAVLYLWQDARLAGLLGEAAGMRHLAGLGAKAVLVWGPVVALTVVTAPQRWRHAVW